MKKVYVIIRCDQVLKVFDSQVEASKYVKENYPHAKPSLKRAEDNFIYRYIDMNQIHPGEDHWIFVQESELISFTY